MARTRSVMFGLALALGLMVLALVSCPGLSFAGEPPRWIRVEVEKDAARAAVTAAAPSPEVQAKDDKGKEYVLIRAGDETIRGLLARGLKVSNATQADFVHRFFEIRWQTNEQRQALLTSGLDLIEFNRGQRQALVWAMDGDVGRLREKGLEAKPREDLDARAKEAHVAALTSPDAGAYHTYEEVQAELNDLAKNAPDRAQVHELGLTVQGRKILAIEIGDRSGDDPKQPRALVLGCHHAREWISVEIPMKLAKALLENPSHDADVESIVKTSRTWIIPMLNPDGHHYSVTTNRMWRKNLRYNGDGTLGVDLNRNYGGPDWGKPPGSSDETYSETYHGPSAFSEPETRAVRDLITGLPNLRGLVTYHSFSQLILYPWGYTDQTAPNIDAVRKQAETYRDRILKAGGLAYTAEQASALYITNGDTTDYTWEVSKNKVAPLTVELRPTSAADGGFILPESQIEPTWNENKPALLGLLKTWTTVTDGRAAARAKRALAPKP